MSLTRVATRSDADAFTAGGGTIDGRDCDGWKSRGVRRSVGSFGADGVSSRRAIGESGAANEVCVEACPSDADGDVSRLANDAEGGMLTEASECFGRGEVARVETSPGSSAGMLRSVFVSR